MSRAAHDIEHATPALSAEGLARVRSSAHRRRVARRSVQAVAAVALVGAVGAALLVSRPQALPADPTPAPSPTVSADPSPTPTPTPSPTPTDVPAGPAERAAEIDDATALARLVAPRTGEVWTAATRVDPVTPPQADAPVDWYLVGHRGDVPIYAATRGTDDGDAFSIWSSGLTVALYEKQGDVLRHIACPSARTGDACGTPLDGAPAQPDTETFYDSLTPPRTVVLPGGYPLRTGATWGTPGAVPGSMAAVHYGTELRVLDELGGGLQVVEQVLNTTPADHPLAGARNVTFGLRLPYGAVVTLLPADVPGGDSAAVVWQDGERRDGPGSATYAPAGLRCNGPSFTVLPTPPDRSAWVPGGTVDGLTVHVPAPGRLELAARVFGWQRDSSYGMDENGLFTEGADAYGFASVEELLASNALFAFEGPGGAWVLGLRGDAANTAYECA
jgi:hypothetical protein